MIEELERAEAAARAAVTAATEGLRAVCPEVSEPWRAWAAGWLEGPARYGGEGRFSNGKAGVFQDVAEGRARMEAETREEQASRAWWAARHACEAANAFEMARQTAAEGKLFGRLDHDVIRMFCSQASAAAEASAEGRPLKSA